MQNHYSVSLIAKLLGVGEETVRRWIRTGKLGAKRGLGRGGSSITIQDLDKFLLNSPSVYRSNLTKYTDNKEIPAELQQYIKSSAATIAGITAIGAAVAPLASPVLPTITAISILQRKNNTMRDETSNESFEKTNAEDETNVATSNIAENNHISAEIELVDKLRENMMRLRDLQQECVRISSEIKECEKSIEELKAQLFE